MAAGDDGNIIIVNLFGGVAGALVEQAFAQLPTFRELKMCSTLYPRCIASHTSARDTLFHFLTDTQNVNDLRAKCKSRSTLFKEMKHMGFETEFRGPFGLKDELEFQWDCTSSLQDWGIDVFDEKDASFCSFSSDKVHDESVFARGLQSASRWKSKGKHALFLNLFGCRSVEKLAWSTDHREKSTRIRVNSVDEDGLRVKKAIQAHIPYPRVSDNGQMEKYVPRSVVVDSFSNESARPHTIPFCLAEYKHRQGDDSLSDEEVIETSLCAHGLAWLHLCNIDKQLERLMSVLKQKNLFETTSIVLLCTKGVSLFEHGTMSSMPWESSLRCFALVHRAGQSHSEVLTNPISSLSFGSLVLHTCGSNIAWKGFSPSSFHQIASALSIQLDASNLKLRTGVEAYGIFEFPAFCIRLKIFYERWYGIAAWFSADQLLNQTEELPDKRSHLLNTRQFANPVTEENCSSLTIQVYDHMTDSEEVHDLYLDAHWRDSPLARNLLSKYFQEVLSLVGSTVTVDFQSFLLDANVNPASTLPRATLDDELDSFLQTHLSEASSRIIKSKISGISGDVTIVVPDDAGNRNASSLKFLPGTFHPDWVGELVVGTNTIACSSSGLTINNSIVVEKKHLVSDGRQLCFAFVRMIKNTEPPRAIAVAKGRVKRVERRGNR